MGVARLTNNQIRPTSIQAMKAAGKSDRFIVTITEHKRESTLKNYDPVPVLEERFDGARAIFNVKEKPKISETVTSTKITKTVSKTSVSHVTEQTECRDAFSGVRQNLEG